VKSKINKVIIQCLEKINRNKYLSLTSREVCASQINAAPDITIFDKKGAIVMQGPIIEKDQFTLETLKIYRKRFPEMILILSTWENYSSDILRNYRDIGVKVIENKKPAYFGISNINLQIESAKNGIKVAHSSGAEYCLKTRTDQRIYRHDFILFFLSLIRSFPIDNSLKPKSRIISISLNTYKYRLYGVTDMLNFGHIDDMLLYWTPEFDSRHLEEMDIGDSVEAWGRARLCEVYLSTEYLQKQGHTLDYTLKDSWNVFSEYFCIVDTSAIDLFWFKYNRWNENSRYNNEYRALDEEFTFSDWINANNNLSLYKSSDEQLLYKKNMSKY